MALLLSFSFSGAVSRFDARRELIVQETNAIGTAWLRVDLRPEVSQPQIRDDFAPISTRDEYGGRPDGSRLDAVISFSAETLGVLLVLHS
jgi:hypothetical protein